MQPAVHLQRYDILWQINVTRTLSGFSKSSISDKDSK
jgi:hypothetical protein